MNKASKVISKLQMSKLLTATKKAHAFIPQDYTFDSQPDELMVDLTLVLTKFLSQVHNLSAGAYDLHDIINLNRNKCSVDDFETFIKVAVVFGGYHEIDEFAPNIGDTSYYRANTQVSFLLKMSSKTMRSVFVSCNISWRTSN